MPLEPGTRLGPYEILSAIGAGGMGEVYKARDTRLNRDVAIKVLPPHVADNPTARARFEREAQAISRQNHPNICAVYDVGEQDGIAFLVMEYIAGESLEHRLRRGALPITTALRFAAQIAAALDAAHRRGLVHRDLKPTNVMVAGQDIKLLDFGVAKLRGEAEAVSTLEATKSLTAERSLVGTLHYMAPEQLEAGEVDPRTDLFAFGAVVYEMLTGRKAFDGASAPSVMAAILTSEPPPPSSTTMADSILSPALDRVVLRALAKSPDERWQTARDLMNELQWIAEDASRATVSVTPSTGFRRHGANIVIVAVVFMVVGATLAWRMRPSPAVLITDPPTVFTISAPDGTRLSRSASLLAVSPDGRTIAFLAGPEDGQDRIWVRSLNSPIPRPLLGTEGASSPFWSPDSRSLGFYGNNQLKRVELAGGQPIVVAEIAHGRASGTPGAFWSSDGTIVFSQTQSLYRVKAGGGTPTLISSPDAVRGEGARTLPSSLPDGRFLYVVINSNRDDSEVRIKGLNQQGDVSLPNVRSNAVLASGYLLFRSGESLVAQAFDPHAVRPVGRPVPIAEGIGYNPANGRTMFAVSADTLAYRLDLPRKLTWRDRTGRPAGSIGEVGRDRDPAIAPGGSGRVAVDRYDPAANTFGIWTVDDRGHAAAVATSARARFPVWSPDGESIAFLVPGAQGVEVRRTLATGAGREEVLVHGDQILPLDWSKDGRFLIYQTGQPGDLWALNLVDRTPAPITKTRRETYARLSPDGHWIAYTSTQAGTGQDDVWVQAFPSGEGKHKISSSGGVDPAWREDGQELFYMARDGNLMAVPVRVGPSTLTNGRPTPLFQTMNEGTTRVFGRLGLHLYASTPDGQRFLVSEPVEAQDRLTVVLHWTSLVRQ